MFWLTIYNIELCVSKVVLSTACDYWQHRVWHQRSVDSRSIIPAAPTVAFLDSTFANLVLIYSELYCLLLKIINVKRISSWTNIYISWISYGSRLKIDVAENQLIMAYLLTYMMRICKLLYIHFNYLHFCHTIFLWFIFRHINWILVYKR